MSATYSVGTGPICPYCNHLHRADDPFFYNEDNEEMDCDGCGRTFHMEIGHTVSWNCSEIEE